MKPIILIFAMLSPVFARIGETERECHKRYGGDTAFKESGGETAVYEKNGMTIYLRFRNGKCGKIIYEKSKGEFGDDEINTLQKANYSGVWEYGTHSDESTIIKVSVDGSIHLACSSGRKSLMILTEAENIASDKDKIENDKKNLEGL